MSEIPNPGERIQIQLDRHDEPREVIVLRTPPFTETIAGTERERTDAIEVEYPGVFDDDDFFGPMIEIVPLDSIVD